MVLHRSSLCSCVLLLVYLCCTTSSAPAALEFVLLSLSSGQFVHVAEDGNITANRTKDTATVFNVLTQGNFISLELKSEPGKFLMLNEIVENSTNTANSTANQQGLTVPSQYKLLVGTPSIVSHLQWEVVSVWPDWPYALKQKLDQGTNCFIAFNNNGSLAGPCDLLQNDPVTFTFMINVY